MKKTMVNGCRVIGGEVETFDIRGVWHGPVLPLEFAGTHMTLDVGVVAPAGARQPLEQLDAEINKLCAAEGLTYPDAVRQLVKVRPELFDACYGKGGKR